MSDENENDTTLRIITRGITAEEAAAVTAVVHAALEQHADESADIAPPVRDAWSRSGARLRQPLQIGPGAWQRADLR